MCGHNSGHFYDIYVPQSVLHVCPVLASRLSPGCRIYNVHPRIFCIIIAHLNLISTFEQSEWLSTPGYLRELMRSLPLQTFVQAWYLCGMLHLPNLQNDITKVLYDSSVAFLNTFHDSCTQIDPLPFVYLRSMCGSGTKAELFLFDFYADVLRNPGWPPDLFQNLPMFVWQGITNSGYQISMRDGGVERYVVREDDGTYYGELQIQPAV